MDRYIVISSDCHAGADLLDYRPYLEERFHDDFDRWAAAFVNPFGDLERPDANRNWDSARRTADMEADGVVAEVVYPNTVPPFFPSGNLVATSPAAVDFEHRLAGLRAHNRWMAEWCAEQPERRAGIGQLLLNDVDEAVRDVHWIADHGLRGGVLLPGIPPGSSIPPLHAPDYDPVWRACEERGLVVNAHGGGASPEYGMYPASLSMWLMEVAWYSHRPLWSFVLSGVFDRFPGLRLVLAEQGLGWLRDALDTMDMFYAQIAAGNVGELTFVEPFLLERMPSEYWETNCAVGASRSASGRSCGEATTRTSRARRRSPRRPSPSPSPASNDPRSRPCSPGTRPRSTGSTSTPSRRSRPRSGRSSPTWPPGWTSSRRVSPAPRSARG
jgi:predicted TIM-barrel fold metal-dependent hydrolase